MYQDMYAIKVVRNAVMNSSKVCNTAASELPLRAILLERRIICGRPGDIGAPERRLRAGAAGDGGQERGAAAGAGARGGRAPPRRAERRRHRRAAAPRCCASPATAVHRAAVLAHPCCDCSALTSRPGRQAPVIFTDLSPQKHCRETASLLQSPGSQSLSLQDLS